MRGRMPNFVARRSLWTVLFGNKWSRVFWSTTIVLIALILVHLNSFGHPFKMFGAGHTVYKVDRVEATCLEDGNIQYYTCWKCDKLYSDAKCTKEIVPEDTIIPKVEHEFKTIEAGVADQSGYQTIKHDLCTKCNGTFDTVTKNPLLDVLTPLVPKEDVVCYDHIISPNPTRVTKCDGEKVDFYHCELCSKTFTDAKGKNEFEDYTTYNREHEIVAVNAKASTCTERGNVSHYKCTKCEKLYSDKTCEKEVQLAEVQLPYDHQMGHGKAAVADKTLDGYEKLHFCWKCEKMFADYDGEREVPRPMSMTLFGKTFSIWTLALAVHALVYVILWTCVVIVIRHQYVEFYDDYVIRKSGVFARKSRRTIFPQLTSVSSKKHLFNYGDVIIDVVGPWDIDLTDIARPGALRDYLLDHMVNSAAVENIGSNPYLASLAPAARDDIYPGSRF